MLRRIGITAWALWGVLHIIAGLGPLTVMLRSRNGDILAAYGTSAAATGAGSPPGVVTALLANHAFNLFWGGLFALVVAVGWNRHGHRGAYLANLAVISGFDVAFLLFMVLPGHVPAPMALVGPALWLIGAVALAPSCSRGREALAPAGRDEPIGDHR